MYSFIQAVFCKDCHSAYHQGACNQAVDTRPSTDRRYTVDSNRAEQARWERQMSENTIQKTTKPCPKCKTPVEKDGKLGFLYNFCFNFSDEPGTLSKLAIISRKASDITLILN